MFSFSGMVVSQLSNQCSRSQEWLFLNFLTNFLVHRNGCFTTFYPMFSFSGMVVSQLSNQCSRSQEWLFHNFLTNVLVLRNGCFSSWWWLSLFFTGAMVGCVISVKFVGLFTVTSVGLFTLHSLWELFSKSNWVRYPK